VLYWRTATGAEVDFVIETPGRLLPIEVKASARVTTKDASGVESFLDEYPDLADGGLLLYAGAETFPLTRRVLVAPGGRCADVSEMRAGLIRDSGSVLYLAAGAAR